MSLLRSSAWLNQIFSINISSLPAAGRPNGILEKIEIELEEEGKKKKLLLPGILGISLHYSRNEAEKFSFKKHNTA